MYRTTVWSLKLEKWTRASVLALPWKAGILFSQCCLFVCLLCLCVCQSVWLTVSPLGCVCMCMMVGPCWAWGFTPLPGKLGQDDCFGFATNLDCMQDSWIERWRSSRSWYSPQFDPQYWKKQITKTHHLPAVEVHVFNFHTREAGTGELTWAWGQSDPYVECQVSLGLMS